MNEEELNELLAARTITSDSELILKVKKPDFLGASMWEFHFEGHTINAGVLDESWLEDFRQDGLGVRPGAALRALVSVHASYTEENDKLPLHYSIIKVFEVIPPTTVDTQLPLRAVLEEGTKE